MGTTFFHFREKLYLSVGFWVSKVGNIAILIRKIQIP